MQKDVECTFGILKGRWRILKTGMRLSGIDLADKTFLTCCTLHNWLPETDAFPNNWNKRIPAADPLMQSSEWDGPFVQRDPDDLNLHNQMAMLSYDSSGM